MDYTIRVIATSLISGTVTVSAQSEAEALAKAEQQINPKLRQEGYEFQLEFLETAERAQSARRLNRSRWRPGAGTGLERNADRAGLGLNTGTQE